MRPVVQLDYVIFQLTPTRTRCELFVSVGGRMEKLAAGLLKPFLVHLKILQEKIANGGYSIRLDPPDPKSASWLTRGTMERFVRFVSTPEVLERVSTVEMELIQLAETKNLHADESAHEEENSAKTTLVVYSPAGGNTTTPVNPPSLDKPLTMKVKQDSSEATEKEEGENGRKRLLSSLDARQVMLQKEQGMAFARAAAAGFTIDSMADLVVFAECFGASRLRDACIRFMELSKKRQEAGLWQEDMALITTEAATLAQGDINGAAVTNSKPFLEFWPDINRLHDSINDKSCDADMLQRQGSFNNSVETNENLVPISRLRSEVDLSNMPSRANSEEANLQFPLSQRYPEGYQGSPYGIARQDQSLHAHAHLMHGAIPPPYLQQAYGYGDFSRTPQLGHPLYYMQTGNLAYPEMINAPPRWWGSDVGPDQFAPYFPPHHQGYYYGDMPHSEAYGDYLHPVPTSTNHGEFPHSVNPFTHEDYPDAMLPHLPSSEEANAAYVLPESQPKREEQNILESVDSENVISTQLNEKCQSEEEVCSPSDDKVDLSSVEKASRRSSQRSSQRSSRRSPSPRRSSSPLRRVQIGRSGQRKPGMVVIRNINYIASKMDNQLAKEREVGDYESSNSLSEENDSAGSDGDSIRLKVESSQVCVQDVIGIFESSEKSHHHSKMRSSRSGSDRFLHEEESFIKNSVLGDLKDDNMNVSGRNVSVGSKEEMEASGVKQESLKETVNGLQNEDMDLVIERGELPSKPLDSLLMNFDHDAQISERNVVTEEDPLIRAREEVRSYGQNLQALLLDHEALPKQSNNNASIADEAVVYSEKNENRTVSVTFSVPEIIAEQEGALCIPKTIEEDAGLLVVSSRQMGDNGRSSDTENRLADFDSEVICGGQEKMNNRDLPDDSFVVPARITEQEKGRVGWRTDVMIEAELPGNNINNQDSESDLKTLEPFEPEDLAMLPERHFDSNSIDNSPNAVVDYNFQMLADMTENGSSILVDRDDDENVLEEQNVNANEDVPLKGSGKKLEREAKMQTVQEALEKRKAEAQARAEKLRAFKASLQKSKKEKEEEERKRVEELKLQRKERIAARATLASPNTQVTATSHQRVKSQVVSQGKSDLSSGRRSNNYIKATASSAHASSLSSLGTKSVQGLGSNGNGSTHSAKAQEHSKRFENLMTKSTSSLVGSEKEIRRDSSVRSSTGSLRFSIPNMSKQGSTNHNKSMAEATGALRRHSLPEAQIDKALKASKKGDRQSRHEPKPSVRKSHSNDTASSKPKTKSKLKSTKKMGKTITLDPVPLAPLKSKDDDERISDCSLTEPSLPTEITTEMEVKTVGIEDSCVGVEYKDGPDINFDIACNDVSLVEVENTVNTVDIQSNINNTAEPELMSFLQPPEDTNDLVKPLSSAYVHMPETTYQVPIAQLPIDLPSVSPPSDATLHETDVPAINVSNCTSSSASAFVTDPQNMNSSSDKSGEEPVSSVLDSLDHTVTRSSKKSVILEKPPKEKEHVKGFRKLLKFGRKSKSGVSSSVSTLEDGVNTEVIIDSRMESLEDFNSKVLSRINEDAPATFSTSKLQDNNVENTAVASSAGNGAVTLSQMISQEEYSQPRGTRSFFSLAKFRSKSTARDSKPR